MSRHGTHQPYGGGDESAPIQRFVVLFALLGIFGVAILIQASGRDNVSAGPTPDRVASPTVAAQSPKAIVPKAVVPKVPGGSPSSPLLPVPVTTVNVVAENMPDPMAAAATRSSATQPPASPSQVVAAAAPTVEPPTPTVDPAPDPMPEPMPTFDLLPNVDPMPNVNPLP